MTDVPAIPLPGEPSLEQLRNQAKDLKDASGVPLWQAQLTVARRYGFTGWARLKRLGAVLASPPRWSAASSPERSRMA